MEVSDMGKTIRRLRTVVDSRRSKEMEMTTGRSDWHDPFFVDIRSGVLLHTKQTFFDQVNRYILNLSGVLHTLEINSYSTIRLKHLRDRL
ncbi:hypothetical protein GGP87_001032 [Salinibacter ruber]|nr:hypothetical protein [Salinibacter ruber]